MNQEIKNNHDLERDFYFSNTYIDNEIKQMDMQNNIYWNLAPFSRYLNASKEHQEKASATGAEVEEIKNESETVLIPDFTLLKAKKSGFKINITYPKEKYYFLKTEIETDNKEFEIRQGRDAIVCDYKDIVDQYNGNIVVKVRENVNFDSEKKCKLWIGDEDSDCSLSIIDYSNHNDYRIDGIAVYKTETTNNEIYLYTNEKIDNRKIKLFGNIEIQIKNITQINSDYSEFKNKEIINLENGFFAIIPKNNQQNYSNKYDEFGNEEIIELIKNQPIKLINGRLIYNSSVAKNKIIIDKLPFNIKRDMYKKKLKDKKGNFIGSFIEIKEDDKDINDIESNVDIFFKENVEYLTDKPFEKRDRRRNFIIGYKIESENIIEIAEEKDNNLFKIENLSNKLFAVVDTRQINFQIKAIDKLCFKPCIYHKNLLELFEKKEKSRWGHFEPKIPENWHRLTDETYDGCDQQRDFVTKALNTPDFAFLDGPPGSGKTTVILEIIAQMVMKEQKIMLTASTNAAIDNILERINDLPDEVKDKLFCVRIGNEDSISDSVNNFSVNNLSKEIGDEIISRANLVCGTIFGILKHPAFNLNSYQPVRPLYDCLIIDEASKTTFQDFLVPAIYAKKWILSGDLKQLTPYIEQDDIKSAIEEIPEFNKNYQFAQTIIMHYNKISKNNDVRWLISVSSDIIKAAEKLLTTDNLIGILSKNQSSSPISVSLEEFKNADIKSCIVYGAKILFVDSEIIEKVSTILPADYIQVFGNNIDLQYLNEGFFKKKKLRINLNNHTCSSVKEYFLKFNELIKEKTWANEITWRLCRIQELFMLLNLNNDKTLLEKYDKEITDMIPDDFTKKIEEYISALKGIALPSIIQLLQNGMDDKVIKNKKETVLNKGFDEEDLVKRKTTLEYQHRMHPDISRFSAENIYQGKALENDKDIEAKREWAYKEFGNTRNIWIDIKANKDCNNENVFECNRIRDEISEFMNWAKNNPQKNDGVWSIACLTYYKKQERRLKEVIKKLFSSEKNKSRYLDKERNIEVVIYTVDKFQGREADIVFISMVKSENANLGFMDSPNRLNVALTRAKYQRIIVGDKKYFKESNKCRSNLLRKLAESEKGVIK